MGWWWIETNSDNQHIIHVTHNAGFFSCCTIRLISIMDYVNHHHMLPTRVDSSRQFHHYCSTTPIADNIFGGGPTEDQRVSYIPPVYNMAISSDFQFWNYHTQLDFQAISPLIDHYFSFTAWFTENYLDILKRRYHLEDEQDFKNICGVMYRGNDKCTEIPRTSYESIIQEAQRIKEKYPDIRFLVQTDETQFLDTFRVAFSPSDCFWFKEIPTMDHQCSSLQYRLPYHQNMQAMYFYVASIYLLSKCKHVICTSGNGESFILFYRGHSRNVSQFLRHECLRHE